MGELRPLNDHFESPVLHRLREDLVVAFALIGVGDGEVGDGPVEFVALAEVSADRWRSRGPPRGRRPACFTIELAGQLPVGAEILTPSFSSSSLLA